MPVRGQKKKQWHWSEAKTFVEPTCLVGAKPVKRKALEEIRVK